jgi:threonine synthase
MGLPIDKLICASNENNILTDFINTGEFDLRSRELLPTISPAIDILLPSNIERLLYFITNDPEKVKSYFDELSANKYFKIDHKIKYAIMTDFLADYCTEEEQIETIREVYKSTNYILDPHTAVAKRIADKYSKKRKNPILIASTAHYAKFPETVMEALDIPQGNNLKETIENLMKIKTTTVFHKNLENILHKPVLHNQILDNDITQIKKAIYDIFKENQLV